MQKPLALHFHLEQYVDVRVLGNMNDRLQMVCRGNIHTADDFMQQTFGVLTNATTSKCAWLSTE